RGHQLLALRYLLENGGVWLKYFSWQKPLSKLSPSAVELIPDLYEALVSAATLSEPDARTNALLTGPLTDFTTALADLRADTALNLIALMSRDEQKRIHLRARLNKAGMQLVTEHPELVDLLFLLTQDLTRYPASTTRAGQLNYVIVADKG